MAITLFVQYQDCPICKTPEAVVIPTKAANFFRCGECHQAVKRGTDGHLVPWLDVYRAGTKLTKTKAKGSNSTYTQGDGSGSFPAF